MTSSKIVPFATWGRTNQKAGGNSKWHLLLDLRRFNRTRGRSGAIFAPTVCGQALDDPQYGPPGIPYLEPEAVRAELPPETGRGHGAGNRQCLLDLHGGPGSRAE